MFPEVSDHLIGQFVHGGAVGKARQVQHGMRQEADEMLTGSLAIQYGFPEYSVHTDHDGTGECVPSRAGGVFLELWEAEYVGRSCSTEMLAVQLCDDLVRSDAQFQIGCISGSSAKIRRIENPIYDIPQHQTAQGQNRMA